MPRRPGLLQLVARVPAEAADEVGAWLVGAGAGGVEEKAGADSTRLHVYGVRRAELVRLAVRLGAHTASRRIPCDVRIGAAPRSLASWEMAWTSSLVPVRVSRSLVLVPTTFTGSPPAGRQVRLGPALVFGFGEHPTTALAARAVERWCARGVASVLDVGTGTGVLAIVASLSGARRAVGIDVDPEAVVAARRNAALSGVAARCRFSETSVERVRGRFDLVVANLDYRTLFAVAPALRPRIHPRGVLLLTGLFTEHARDVEEHYGALGFERSARRKTAGGWALLTLRLGSSGTGRRARRARPGGKTRTPKNR